MSISDPLADFITRIRNGQSAGKREVHMPGSKLKMAVCEVLKTEGYIEDYRQESLDGKHDLSVSLKYFKGSPVISRIERISRPGRRVYMSRERLPQVMGGFGVAVISTSLGVMTDNQARTAGHGGEVLFTVS